MHTSNAEETASSPSLSNREMASLFFNIATVLRSEGNVNPFRTAAYERAARAMMALPEEASAILTDADKVPFRPSQHIGKKLQAKIREMAETGALDQYRALLEELPVHQRNLMTLPGIGPRMADAVYHTLGIATVDGLVVAARDGRLGYVRGFGPKRIAALACEPMRQSKPSPDTDGMPARQLRLFEVPAHAASRYNAADHERPAAQQPTRRH